jgi:hypothetical protein
MQPQSNWQASTLVLTEEERRRCAAAAAEFAAEFHDLTTLEQYWAARVVHRKIVNDVPRLAEHLALLAAEQSETVVIYNLPTDEALAEILVLALSWAVGTPFSYLQQLRGAMSMRIEPGGDDAPANSNVTRHSFGWHTDDAGLEVEYRTKIIGLYGVYNPGSLTAYSPITPAFDKVEKLWQSILMQPRFSVRYPLSFNLGDNIWSEPRAIIGVNRNNHLTVAWPTYATKAADPKDFEAENALKRLLAFIPENMLAVPINEGVFLAFDNMRGLHSRGAIGTSRRLLFRTYVRPDVKALQAATGSRGPVFDLLKLVPVCQAAA